MVQVWLGMEPVQCFVRHTGFACKKGHSYDTSGKSNTFLLIEQVIQRGACLDFEMKVYSHVYVLYLLLIYHNGV